jgi:hypothetical protein
MILADVGVVEYNGYTFDGASNVTIRCEPVYDDAGRTVVYHKYVVNVKSLVAEVAGTDLTLAGIRALLTKAGYGLRVYNKGYGNLIVNAAWDAASVNDVAFGPKPRILSWTPIGSIYACEIEWECEACVAYCYLPQTHSGILAFNYGITYALDYRGLTTRTIAGYYEIAMSRNGYAIPDTADNYRTLVSPAIPERFQRTTQSYALSLDKRRCDFNVTDQELPSNNPWPAGVVKAEGRHRVNWTRSGGNANRLFNQIGLDVEMGADQPMLNAYAAFAAIVKQRLNIVLATDNYGVMIDTLSVEESLFDRQCSFSCSYRLTRSLKQILTDTGLWQPLGLNTWGAWSAAIQGLTDQRGYANMQHLAANDAIVDPCGATFTIPWDAVAVEKPQQAVFGRLLLANDTPAPENSWLEYDAHVFVLRDRATVRHAIMQPPDEEDAAYNPQDAAGLKYPVRGGTDDILQRSGKSRHTAVFQGHAKRAGHPIPRPSLTQVGDVAAQQALRSDDFIQRIQDNWLGVPIYVAKWNIVYNLAGEPGAIDPPANLAKGVQSDGTAEMSASP